jgi:FHA domain
MNLESPTNQPPADRPVPTSDVAIKLPPPQLSDDLDGEAELDNDLDNELSSELDADSASRFITLMLNTPGSSSDREFKPLPKSSFKYVQGVVHGQQAYLITNLRGESQTLFQPQMVWTIGRNRDAALPLAERSLSRRHAVILFLQDQGFQLIDLNSMNGSFVNEEPVRQRSPLQDGDYVRLGSAEFIFLTSLSYRTIDFVHPEVLARFTAPKLGAGEFFDYAES